MKHSRKAPQDEAKDQGPKTRAKNREMTKSGSPDQGTQ
jgi:hypothetical protein